MNRVRYVQGAERPFIGWWLYDEGALAATDDCTFELRLFQAGATTSALVQDTDIVGQEGTGTGRLEGDVPNVVIDPAQFTALPAGLYRAQLTAFRNSDGRALIDEEDFELVAAGPDAAP